MLKMNEWLGSVSSCDVTDLNILEQDNNPLDTCFFPKNEVT